MWVSRAPASDRPTIGGYQKHGDTRKVYLSPIVDLYDSRPVAWSIGTRPDAALADSSLEAACATLAPGEAPSVHTDRGCHYRWPGWKRICAEHGLERSMSRKGRPPDNAAVLCQQLMSRNRIGS